MLKHSTTPDSHMEPQLLGALALYSFATSATPGPNNLMLASSGLNFGFRRTLSSLIGIELGFIALILLVGAGLGTVILAVPPLQWALKLFGAAYLVWLAWQLWRAGEIGESAHARPIGFWRGALFQAVNPKAWMMVIGAIGAFTSPGSGFWLGVVMIAAVFAVIGFPCLSAWALFGSSIRRFLKSRRAFVTFNRVMAGLTALTAGLIFI